MALYSYPFTGTDTAAGSGVGAVPSGHPSLSALVGSWRRLSNRAYTTTGGASNPILVGEFNSADVDARVDVSNGGGDAVYVRVVDANNWIRARVRRWQVTSGGGGGYVTVTEYQWQQNYSHSNTTHSHYDNVCNNLSGNPARTGWGSFSSPPSFPTTVSWSHTHSTCDPNTGNFSHSGGYTKSGSPSKTGSTRTSQEYVSYPPTTTTYRQVVLERCVNGTITTLASTPQTTSSTLNQVRLRAQGNALSVYLNGSASASATANSTTHNGATRHGIGRGTSELYGHALDNFVIDTLNTAPSVPTQTAPSSSTPQDGDGTIRLQWIHNDPDPNDNQTQAEVQVRTAAGTVVATGTVSGSTARYDITGGTLDPGNHEWRVRTRDSQGAWSPFSGWRTLVVGVLPDDPTITAPVNGSTISTLSAQATWSVAEQDAYRIRVLRDGQVRYDSGVIETVSTRAHTVPFPDNGQTETIELTVRLTGLWSSAVTVEITTSFTPPPEPTVQVDGDSMPGVILVEGTHPDPVGSEPAVIGTEIWRRPIDTSGDGIRIRQATTPLTIYRDYEFEPGTEYAYRIRDVGDNGTQVWSEWTAASTLVLGYYGGGYEGDD